MGYIDKVGRKESSASVIPFGIDDLETGKAHFYTIAARNALVSATEENIAEKIRKQNVHIPSWLAGTLGELSDARNETELKAVTIRLKTQLRSKQGMYANLSEEQSKSLGKCIGEYEARMAQLVGEEHPLDPRTRAASDNSGIEQRGKKGGTFER